MSRLINMDDVWGFIGEEGFLVVLEIIRNVRMDSYFLLTFEILAYNLNSPEVCGWLSFLFPSSPILCSIPIFVAFLVGENSWSFTELDLMFIWRGCISFSGALATELDQLFLSIDNIGFLHHLFLRSISFFHIVIIISQSNSWNAHNLLCVCVCVWLLWDLSRTSWVWHTSVSIS